MTTKFPVGKCCAGDRCTQPKHELRHHCPVCNGYIHILCGIYVNDGNDSYYCNACYEKKKTTLSTPPYSKPTTPTKTSKPVQYIELATKRNEQTLPTFTPSPLTYKPLSPLN